LADSICISQKDNSEKGKQVQQMGKVYEVATHTVIFLGEGDPSIEVILSHIISPHDGSSLIQYQEDTNAMSALDRLLRCPWFYRVWVFQELVLSKDPRVQYGRARFPWCILCDLASSFVLKAQIAISDGLTLCKASSSLDPGVPLQERFFLHQRIDIVSHMNTSRTNSAKANTARSFFDSSLPVSKHIEDDHLKLLLATVSEDSLSLLSSRQEPRKWEEGTKHAKEFVLNVLQSRRVFGASDPRDMLFAHIGLGGKHWC
jgi:Heterokaryon incompatibility protein (HET)